MSLIVDSSNNGREYVGEAALRPNQNVEYFIHVIIACLVIRIEDVYFLFCINFSNQSCFHKTLFFVSRGNRLCY